MVRPGAPRAVPDRAAGETPGWRRRRSRSSTGLARRWSSSDRGLRVRYLNRRATLALGGASTRLPGSCSWTPSRRSGAARWRRLSAGSRRLGRAEVRRPSRPSAARYRLQGSAAWVGRRGRRLPGARRRKGSTPLPSCSEVGPRWRACCGRRRRHRPALGPGSVHGQRRGLPDDRLPRGRSSSADARVLYPSDADFEYVGTEKYRQIREQGTGSVGDPLAAEGRGGHRRAPQLDPLDRDDWSLGVTFTALDITASKRAEAALRESERRYRTLAEAAHDMIFLIDRDDRVEFVNRFAAEQFGATPASLVGRSRSELFRGELGRRQGRNLAQVLESGQELYVEQPAAFPGGERWLGTWLVPLPDEGGRPRGVLGISRDISEQKATEREIGETRAELERRTRFTESVLENLPLGVVVVELGSGAASYMNRRFVEIHGWPEEAIGDVRRFLERVMPDPVVRDGWVRAQPGRPRERRPATAALGGDRGRHRRGGDPARRRLRGAAPGPGPGHLHGRGHDRAAPARGAAPAGAEDGGDRPARGRRGPRLQQPADRHPGLRRPAAAASSPAADRLARTSRRSREAARAGGGADAAAAGVQPQAGAASPRCSTSTRSCAADARACCAASSARTSTCVTALAPDLGRGRGPIPARSSRSILNLAVNARDAMPRGGRLILETADVDDAGAALVRQRRTAVAGPLRQARRSPTPGAGMTREVLRAPVRAVLHHQGARARAPGSAWRRSTASCRQSGGRIQVESTPGRGTTFTHLPPARRRAALGTDPRAATEALTDPRPGETVLVVEDDERGADPGRRDPRSRRLHRAGRRRRRGGGGAGATAPGATGPARD